MDDYSGITALLPSLPVQQDNSRVELLLRQMIAQLDTAPLRAKFATMSFGGEHETFQEIVFDLYVEGVRYVLIRSFAEPPMYRANLSPREREIAELIAKGYPNKVIAAVLEISTWTVATHIRRIFTKLGVKTRAEMVARVLQSYSEA